MNRHDRKAVTIILNSHRLVVATISTAVVMRNRMLAANAPSASILLVLLILESIKPRCVDVNLSLGSCGEASKVTQ